MEPLPEPEALSAVTLFVSDMKASCRFYLAMGFRLHYGGPDEPFTSFRAGSRSYLNLQAAEKVESGWGRWIVHVRDPDQLWARAEEMGFAVETDPADAVWGERYFHVRDPDGHELSLAREL